MSQITKLAAVVGLTLASTSAFSATWVADARGNAMGNTGVTTADFLLAPFYNPALTAVYRDEDDFGLLLPAINVSARDTDESLSTIDDLQDAVDASDTTSANNYAAQLSDDKPITVNVGLTAAVALPIDMLSANLFARGYAEIFGKVTGSGAYTNYDVQLTSFVNQEFGIALAKQMEFGGEKFSFGFTPKIQKLTTYSASDDVETFELDNYDQSEKSKSAFNFDLGALWLVDNYRVGIAIKDIISQTIETNTAGTSYKLDPQVTLSAGYVSDYFTASVDVDATKQEHFVSSAIDDDTQFLRFGIEGNAWGWAQLRAGYEMDMKDTVDDSITAGIGISPGDVVSIDLAGTYAGENQFGAALNLAFTF